MTKHFTDPETRRHKISIRQLKIGVKLIHRFPSGEFTRDLYALSFKEVVSMVQYWGYVEA